MQKGLNKVKKKKEDEEDISEEMTSTVKKEQRAMRNRASAARSRKKKMEYFSGLEAKVTELEDTIKLMKCQLKAKHISNGRSHVVAQRRASI